MRILILDPFKQYREIIASFFREIGFGEIVEVETGIEAINKIKKLPRGIQYDLITIDVVLPQKNGLHTLKDVTLLSPKSKILVCSSTNDLRTVRIAKEFGVDGYILKPFTRESFLGSFVKLYTKV